jgi:putative CocE/NonD family hydrolase
LPEKEPPCAGIFQVHLEENVAIPMRDGISLATDLHRPAARGRPIPGRFPVLLQRTPYDKSAEARRREAAFFAARGYVVAVQDCRGTHASPGGFTKYVSDGPDGYDTIEWLAGQSWSNDKVGTYGLSYAAHAQAALACLNPPHLGCMWLECGGFSDAFHSGCRNGGAFELRQATWAFREALESLFKVQGSSAEGPDQASARTGMEAQDIFDWFRRMPWEKGHGPLRWVPGYEDYLLELWGNETYGPYWRQVGLSVSSYLEGFSDVPQVHMGAWYDPYTRTTTDNFVALAKAPRKGPVHLIMGPWTHGGHGVTYAGDIDLGPQSVIEGIDGNWGADYNQMRLAFFDRGLKGLKSAAEEMPAVRIFVMGGGSGRRNPQGRLDHGGNWRVEAEWPLVRAQETFLYLGPEGGLAPQAPQGASAPSRYLFDPNHPVPTIGGNISSGQPIMYPGGFDQRESQAFFGCREPYLPLASRPDVLVFQSEALAQDMEVTGPVSVRLWVGSTAPDTDFTAKLLDVYPPSADYPEGYALNLTDGILRVKFRDSWEEPRPLEPGAVYPVKVEMFPTSNLFLAGHRVRLDISSSNFPRFDVNGNTGENPAWSPSKVTAENLLYHDGEHPSHLMLPVIPGA